MQTFYLCERDIDALVRGSLEKDRIADFVDWRSLTHSISTYESDDSFGAGSGLAGLFATSCRSAANPYKTFSGIDYTI